MSGGFTNASPQGGDGSNSPARGKYSTGPQTLTPVTIRQLLNAVSQNEEFKIDGRTLSLLTFVGMIQKLSEQTTALTIDIEDGTGVIGVRMWNSNEGQDEEATTRHDYKEGTYVRVFGELRGFHNGRSVYAVKIVPILDHNEITYHNLEVIYVHLYNTKNPGDYPSSSSSLSSRSRDPPPGLSPVCQAVWGVIARASVEGCATQDIFAKLPPKFQQQQVRDALDFLSREAHIVSSASEDHWRISDAR